MNISLFDSVIPGEDTKERKEFIIKTRIGAIKNDKLQTQNTKLALLILTVAKETANAILENQFKKFDALVKNFGCHITALEVQQLMKKNVLRKEAKIVIAEIDLIMSKQKGSAYSIKEPMEVYNYIKAAGLDINVSPEFAHLVRFRMLNIVNDNILNNEGYEVPVTNLKLLNKKIKKSYSLPTHLLISGIQAEESRRAAPYIKNQADLLSPEEVVRASIIQRLLDHSFLRSSASYKYSSIVSTPLLYSTEAVFRRTKGLVLIKNKLNLLGERIKNIEAIKVFIEFPSQKILQPKELNKYSDQEPILVVEGYVRTQNLIAMISELGIFTILNANAAVHPNTQYASGCDQSSFGDEEADQDVAFFKAKTEILNDVPKN